MKTKSGRDLMSMQICIETLAHVGIGEAVPEGKVFEWNGQADGNYGPLVLFDTDDFTGVMDTKKVYRKDGEIWLVGHIRDTNIDDFEITTAHVAGGDLPYLLYRLQNP